MVHPDRMCRRRVLSLIIIYPNSVRNIIDSRCRSSMMTTPVHLLFWAKTDRKNPDSEWIRPLWSHLIDVAVVAEVLWDRVLPPSLRHDIAHGIGCSEDQARSFLCFMAGMHDIGKAIPSFQHLHVPSRDRLQTAGLTFPKKLLTKSRDAIRVHHAHATYALLRHWESRRSPRSGPIFENLAFLLGLHHSKAVTLSSSRDRTEDRHGGPDSWGKAQLDLIDCIVDILDPYIPGGTETKEWQPWTYLFIGLVTYADWLASIDDGDDRFPLYDGEDLHAYLPVAREHAASLIERLYIDRVADIVSRDFGDIFVDPEGRPFIPNPFQRSVIDLTNGHAADDQLLTIIEAPTGGGKTEAALYLALTRQSKRKGRGIYLAMPTQATSNGLFTRFEQALSRGHRAGSFVNALLVHGHSNLDPRQEDLVRRISLLGRMEAIMEDDERPDMSSEGAIVATASWFLPKKRALLAPYGIGTIDQTLLAVLQSRFFFLRLLGLADKTIVFDEVHAYDTYMLTLLCRLVQWLRAIGSDVIILSATLPGPTKQRLIEAWAGTTATIDGNEACYPAVTLASGNDVVMHELPRHATRTVHLRFPDHDPAHRNIVERALDAWRAGCAVAIVCNTVDRSIDVFRALLDAAGATTSNADSLSMFILHSRMTHSMREQKEDVILRCFGKDYDGERRGIVVGTQILEQSLDIDFDVMFSDIAPIDLVIQRAGRIHRHSHRQRPSGYEQPNLHIVMPPRDSAKPSFTSVAAVYDELIMRRTWDLLRTIDSFDSPGDIRTLIGRVYDDVVDDLDSGMAKALARHEASTAVSRQMARKVLIDDPHHAASIMEGLPLLDDENIENRIRASTRLADNSIRVLCLHADDDGNWFLDPALRRPFNAELLTTTTGIREALENEAPISKRAVVHALLDMMKDEQDGDVRYWKTLTEGCPALGYLTPLVFDDLVWEAGDGSCTVGFDAVIGLEID